MTEHKPTARVRDGIIRRGGTWSYVIRVTDVSGASKPRRVGGFPTEEAAKQVRDEARVSARRNEYVTRSDMTLERYLRQWLDGHALHVKPKTHEDYRRLIDGYIVPRLGKVRLQALTPAMRTSFYRTLHESGARDGGPLSARSVQYVHAVLRKALNDAALTDQVIPINPALRAKGPRVPAGQPVRHMWSAHEPATFLDADPAFPLRVYAHVLRDQASHAGDRFASVMAAVSKGVSKEAQ